MVQMRLSGHRKVSLSGPRHRNRGLADRTVNDSGLVISELHLPGLRVLLPRLPTSADTVPGLGIGHQATRARGIWPSLPTTRMESGAGYHDIEIQVAPPWMDLGHEDHPNQLHRHPPHSAASAWGFTLGEYGNPHDTCRYPSVRTVEPRTFWSVLLGIDTKPD